MQECQLSGAIRALYDELRGNVAGFRHSINFMNGMRQYRLTAHILKLDCTSSRLLGTSRKFVELALLSLRTGAIVSTLSLTEAWPIVEIQFLGISQ